MWFLLSILSSLSYSVRRYFEKTVSKKADNFTLGFAVQAFSLPGIALLLFFTKILNPLILSNKFWIPLLIIWFVLYPTQAYFYYKSLKEGEISFVLPLLSLIPLFTVISSWILISETPSFLGLLGIITIVIGIYTLNMKSDKKFFSPIAHLFTDKPSLYMIINCICLATGATLDKIAIQASNPFYYAFVNTLGASIILCIIAYIVHPRFYSSLKQNTKEFASIGILQSIAFICFIYALSIGIVPYVAAIKSTSVIIISILGLIILKETVNRNKIFAYCFICLGLILIAYT